MCMKETIGKFSIIMGLDRKQSQQFYQHEHGIRRLEITNCKPKNN